MSDQVLDGVTYANLRTTYNGLSADAILAVERATIAALTARSGVDVEALVGPHSIACNSIRFTNDDGTPWDCTCHHNDFADALRLAIATAEARHAANPYPCAEQHPELVDALQAAAEREVLWRELMSIEPQAALSNGRDDWDAFQRRIDELRAALGLA